jgi:hypothetical protein
VCIFCLTPTSVFRSDEGQLITSPKMRPQNSESEKKRRFIMHYPGRLAFTPFAIYTMHSIHPAHSPVMTSGCIFNLIQTMEGRWNGTAHLHLYMGGDGGLPKVASTELGFSHERSCWWMREQLTTTTGMAESSVNFHPFKLDLLSTVLHTCSSFVADDFFHTRIKRRVAHEEHRPVVPGDFVHCH